MEAETNLPNAEPYKALFDSYDPGTGAIVRADLEALLAQLGIEQRTDLPEEVTYEELLELLLQLERPESGKAADPNSKAADFLR